MVSARTGSWCMSTRACSATGSPQAARPKAPMRTKAAARMVPVLVELEAGGRTGVTPLAANRNLSRRRRMAGALQQCAVDVGRADAIGERRTELPVDRLDEVRRDDDDQLRFLALVGVRLEQRTQHRDVAQPRELHDVLLRGVLQQTGDGEALAVAELDRRR